MGVSTLLSLRIKEIIGRRAKYDLLSTSGRQKKKPSDRYDRKTAKTKSTQYQKKKRWSNTRHSKKYIAKQEIWIKERTEKRRRKTTIVKGKRLL